MLFMLPKFNDPEQTSNLHGERVELYLDVVTGGPFDDHRHTR